MAETVSLQVFREACSLLAIRLTESILALEAAWAFSNLLLLTHAVNATVKIKKKTNSNLFIVHYLF
jgi:hypothetical protein